MPRFQSPAPAIPPGSTVGRRNPPGQARPVGRRHGVRIAARAARHPIRTADGFAPQARDWPPSTRKVWPVMKLPARSEEHTSELQSLMRISYAVFCLKKKKKHKLALTYCTYTNKSDNIY